MTGRGFSIRNNEHLRKAKAPRSTTDSRFYRRYPSIHRRVCTTNAGRRGHFESLTQCVALGFPMDDDLVNETLTKTEEGESIFAFDAEDIQLINKLKVKGRVSFTMKCIEMISYLIELAFDLSISVLDNVSLNAGFESCHGEW